MKKLKKRAKKRMMTRMMRASRNTRVTKGYPRNLPQFQSALNQRRFPKPTRSSRHK